MNKFSSIFCTVTYLLTERTDFPEIKSLLDSKRLQDVVNKISTNLFYYLLFLFFKTSGLTFINPGYS